MLTEFYNLRGRLSKAYDIRDIKFLNEKQIIGMTSTFAARRRNMLSGLDSTIMIIEEAGEILNASNLAILNRNIKHLILIGDH
jgi:AAA domain